MSPSRNWLQRFLKRDGSAAQVASKGSEEASVAAETLRPASDAPESPEGAVEQELETRRPETWRPEGTAISVAEEQVAPDEGEDRDRGTGGAGTQSGASHAEFGAALDEASGSADGRAAGAGGIVDEALIQAFAKREGELRSDSDYFFSELADAPFETPTIAPEYGETPHPSGRWDPIPPLRPSESSWRDSSGARAVAAEALRRAGLDMTGAALDPAPTQAASVASEQEALPPDEQAPEPVLTRQWGLLSRFQQARGLAPGGQKPDASRDSVPASSPQTQKKP